MVVEEADPEAVEEKEEGGMEGMDDFYGEDDLLQSHDDEHLLQSGHVFIMNFS